MLAKIRFIQSVVKFTISVSFILSTILTPLSSVYASKSITTKSTLDPIDRFSDSLSEEPSESDFPPEELDTVFIEETDTGHEFEDIVLKLEAPKALVFPGRSVATQWELVGWENIADLEGLELFFFIPDAIDIIEGLIERISK